MMVDEVRKEHEVRGYRVEGRVQGVGFRWWARKTASALGVHGRVRNLADGTVEAHASGPPEALDMLERRLREGPSLADVTRVASLNVTDGLRRQASGWVSFEIDR